MKTASAAGSDKPFYLPDFCTSRAALGIVLIVELTALVLTLARDSATIGFWTDLARTSFFLLWIGLAGAGLLCWMGGPLKRLRVAQGSAAVLVLITGLITVVSAATFILGRATFVGYPGLSLLFPPEPGTFLLRNVAIGFVVTALALRYFYVTHEWRRNIEMEAAARVHALQARIRPHFLFNSMNTIASLTRTHPQVAEQTVQDLADLFRANLSEKRNIITLEEE
ncbi:MAG TPA: histidine kinase, partial [Steroidobacteraceae bacterium]|nr:histidine kinase [Steroidobacteraceae bacterium]